MKNSSDKTAPALSKKQGPIRFEAIIPLLIVVGVFALYFTLFFDTHLRRGLEYGATLANGAEVNIGKLDASVWKASVIIGDIAMTDPVLPARNRVQIGAVNFRMLWDALLRGKIVIDEASIVDVQIDTPRTSPGRVLPVKKTEDGESLTDKALTQMKTEFSGNVLGDLAAIASGADPKEQLAGMSASLKSSAQIDTIQKSLDEKNQQWLTRMAGLPKGEDFSALQHRLANVQLDNLKDVAQIQASVKELESIRNDFDAKSKLIREVGTALTGDIGEINRSVSGLDKFVKDDVRSLQAQMHLPSLDAGTLSRTLFGMDVLGKVQQARGYMDQARSYMPVKSNQKKPAPEQKRAKGHDYVFGQPNSYPRFWLRKALISSRLSGGASDLSGELHDVSTNPAMIGRPMTAKIRGNFPQQGIAGIKADLVIDHTTSAPVERLAMEVGKFAVAGRSLVSSPNVELGFSKAEGSAKFAAELRDDRVDVHLTNQFTRVTFQTNAQSQVVREMMNASVQGLDAVNLDARVTGTWSSLNWKLSTNLAEALVAGMQRYLQAKMDEARTRIESMVNGKIETQRKQLCASRDKIEANLKSGLAERQAQAEKLRVQLDTAHNKLDERKKALLSSQQQKLKQGVDSALDKLRKKF